MQPLSQVWVQKLYSVNCTRVHTIVLVWNTDTCASSAGKTAHNVLANTAKVSINTEIVNWLNMISISSIYRSPAVEQSDTSVCLKLFVHSVSHKWVYPISNEWLAYILLQSRRLLRCNTTNEHHFCVLFMTWTATSTFILVSSCNLHCMANSNNPQQGTTIVFNQTGTFCNHPTVSAQDRQTDQFQTWSQFLLRQGLGWGFEFPLFLSQNFLSCSFLNLHCCC